MTAADDIRREAIERSACFDYERERAAGRVHGDLPWGSLPESVRDEWRSDAAGLVDALGDLLPDGIETSPEQSLWRWKHEWQEVGDDQ
ncbi:hypothetical protein NDR87_31620 [Nocardia sp. CDC159]|uniref:Uncharacterized protein n=1 Tax=Nocardia pulmonis TaxID=2951408 RepID=A0A9X2EEB8_9NOCA|nr:MULTISPECIES: hypothetical protein [Nocardia]MCM6777900.1 hypothetical protein [Nocardia pulmonis]MCM6790929.1 hypothetical protein [Nocardia sp. CDC159]